MKFSETWLREWVDPELTTEALGDRLTMAGLELDGLEPAAPAFSGVVVAQISDVAPHPDADRLRVCVVDDGGSDPLQVVCGAPNARVGLRVPFARVGANLPDGTRLKKARLRGVESFGMLCSARELGLAERADGLMELPGDSPVGTSLREYLSLDDTVFEVDLTPNRADCLSISGVAREVATLTRAPLRATRVADIDPTSGRQLAVHIRVPAACPHYAGRIIEGIDAQAETPLWIRERLRRSGIRSLGPLVDVTNYVMMEMGQPMHAFDVDRLQGDVVVRYADAEENLTLLDGQSVTLHPDVLVIADERRPLALAGVMGGSDSAVGDATRDIFLESAFFTPESIAGRARRYGLHTDSSHRFERGVDPDLQVAALQRATGLLLDIAGGRAGPVTEVREDSHVPRRNSIPLRSGRITRLLGITLADEDVERILESLGCTVDPDTQGWRVTPPSYRFDLGIEADLIEELGRVHGYDRVPASHPGIRLHIEPLPEARVGLDRVRSRLVDLGYLEAVTFSFVDAALEERVNPAQAARALSNPLSREMSVMRTTLWSGLLPALKRNLNRQQQRVRLFETGLRFLTGDDGLIQRPAVAGAVTGPVFPEQWSLATRETDFHDLKGDVESLLSLVLGASPRFEPSGHPALHPGLGATILLDGTAVGECGALHPQLEAELGLEQRVFLFELDTAVFDAASVPSFTPLSRHPAVRRDIAIVVDQAVSAQQVQDVLAAEGVGALTNVSIFDVYTGEGVTDGRKSMALGLILQEISRTLTDEEVEQIVGRLIDRLRQELGAALRE